MSRRKQLERDAVATMVADRSSSRGPCPGPCNAAYRRRRAEWERDVLGEFERLLQVGGEVSIDVLMERAQATVLARWEKEAKGAWPARDGSPVWCMACTFNIRRALDRLPRMLLLTLETGETTPLRPDRSPVTAPVRVLDSSSPDADGLQVDTLSCGHRRTRQLVLGPLPRAVAEPVCRTCVAGASVPEPGRLAPSERAARRGQRQPVSPAGSPAWLEVDAAIQVVCSFAEQAAYRLGATRRGEDGEWVERWPWRLGSTQDRVASAVGASRWLARHLDRVLALPDPMPLSLGRSVVSAEMRAREVSGMKIAERALADDCPGCGRRGLVQEDESTLVHCRSCSGHWDEQQFLEKTRGVGEQ